MPKKDQKKAKSKKEVVAQQQQEPNRLQRQQEESKAPQKQQIMIESASEKDVIELLKKLNSIVSQEKLNIVDNWKVFERAVNLLASGQINPPYQGQFVQILKASFGNMLMRQPDLFKKMQTETHPEFAKVIERLGTSGLDEYNERLQNKQSSELIKQTGDKQEDNYQLQFINEMIRYLTTAKGGINQNQLNSLSNGLFNPNDIKTKNVIDSNNIDQFKTRFTDLLTQNPLIKAKFIQLTPMFQKTIIDRIQKSQQSPDKKQQQEQQLNDVVSQLSQSTLSQQSSKYGEENKSQGSQFSGRLSQSIKTTSAASVNSSNQSNAILNASFGQVTESDRSMSDNIQFMQNPSAKGSKVSQVNRSLASQEYDAFQELPEKIDVLNNTMSKSDKMRLSKRHLQSIHNSSYTQAVGSNNGMNMSQGSINRLNRESEVQNSSIVPSNNTINAFVNHGVIPQNPNPLAHEHDIENAIRTVALRMETVARRLGLPQTYINRVSELPQRLMQAQQQANVQAEEAKVQMAQNEEAEQSRFSSNQQLQGSGIANMSAGNIVAQRDQTLSDQTISLNAIVMGPAFGQSVQNLINRSNLTSQQASLASQSLSAENIIPNLIASSAQQISQSNRSQSRNNSQSESDKSEYLRIIPNFDGQHLGDLDVQQVLDEMMQAQRSNRSQSENGGAQSSQDPSVSRSSRSSRSVTNDSVDYGSQILASDEDMPFDFSNLHNDAASAASGGNPFDAWADYVNRANNQTIIQGDPAQPRFRMPKVAITAGDLAKYMTQAVKFISEISGPISSVILATYKKQTSVFKGKVEKKETTKFKVKPGAMFRLRCCD